MTADNNDDDNGFTLTSSVTGVAFGTYRTTLVQATGADLTITLYFVVGAGTSFIHLRNFDLDLNVGAVTYTRPDMTTIIGSISDNGEWNGSNPGPDTGEDVVMITGPGDLGVWSVTFEDLQASNQFALEILGDGTTPLPGFFDPPDITPTVEWTAADVPVAADGALHEMDTEKGTQAGNLHRDFQLGADSPQPLAQPLG